MRRQGLKTSGFSNSRGPFNALFIGMFWRYMRAISAFIETCRASKFPNNWSFLEGPLCNARASDLVCI